MGAPNIIDSVARVRGILPLNQKIEKGTREDTLKDETHRGGSSRQSILLTISAQTLQTAART